MVRSIAIALTLITGSATAGEFVDCYNDEYDSDIRYTTIQPEALRITDADVSAILERIREHENRAVASAEPAMLVRLDSEKSPSD